jgi:light-regulated signal transduction histidine kinase (bacteriophytochrome)
LVAEVLQGLDTEIQARTIHWNVHPLPDVHADETLLRQVFVNLIGNALKYTRLKPVAEIEVGVNEGPGESVFFVRDNGVGFDMKYAGKLFCVFQRLHSENEFEGHGIGLANVKRIVSRHGGRTWAEAEEGKGAVFYFSLPKKPESPSGPIQK